MGNEQTLEKKAATRNGVSRLVFAALSILLEITLIVLLFTVLNRYAEWVNTFTRILALILVLTIYGQHKTSTMKMPWIMLIMAFPVMGVVLYLLVGLNGTTRKMRNRFEKIDKVLLPKLPDSHDLTEQMKKEDAGAAGISAYLSRYSGYPVYQNTDVRYYDDAAKGLEAQLAEIAKAEKFVFMEYHAIEDKEAWHRIQMVLEERVKAGVEVRVFYDDMGSIGFINTDFVKKLESVGIKCRVFNPFAPGLNLFLNNRDHRKITVVDGKVGFTGGYNLANEYFNITHPYGQWKDTGIRLEGDAVRSLTITFLEMWNAIKASDQDDTDIDRYLPESDYQAEEKGYVQPYADSPMDDEQVGEEVYISMANKAEKYCYYITPYLIITDEMTHALSLAAKRGVDVRIITPGIPDKKLIYRVTRSYYGRLASAGVKIYEYTPGFVHAKQMLADGNMAVVGTINMDYRSLYHHFENAVLMYGFKELSKLREDFEETFAVSEEVTSKYQKNRYVVLRGLDTVLRLIAPLL